MGDVVYTFEPTTQTTDEIRLWVSEVDKQAAAALEAAVRFQENRIALLGDSGGIVTTAAGRGRPPRTCTLMRAVCVCFNHAG
jgi:hypothetical protein